MDQRVLQNFLDRRRPPAHDPVQAEQAARRPRPPGAVVRAGPHLPRGRGQRDPARFHPDYAALRRYLVENGFMTREDSVYWRSGGTFDV